MQRKRRSVATWGIVAAAALMPLAMIIESTAAVADPVPDDQVTTTTEVEEVVPTSQHSLVDFSTESDPWPGPGALDGTAQAPLSDNWDDTWVVRYTDGGGPTEDYPHWYTFDVGETMRLSGLEYGVKANQGHIGDYRIYVSDDPAVLDTPRDESLWGDPVLEGSFATGTYNHAHQLDFLEPVEGRFIRIMIDSCLQERFPGQPVAASWIRAKQMIENDGPVLPKLPQVIPSMSNEWVYGDDTFTLAPGTKVGANNQELLGSAELLASEIANYLNTAVTAEVGSAMAGDVELVLDPVRTDLGDEAYELKISDRITVTGATPTGVLYGTRTVAQLLLQTFELPQGQSIDAPAYSERGLTLSASYTIYSSEWIDRMLEEMAYLKLNYLLLEIKMPSENYPETATWGYYTKDEMRQIVTKAKQLGITVIPEVNSPGHMSNWLLNRPDLQLMDQLGNRDVMRLDITTEEAFEFYTTLIDEYLEIFDGPFWHMGADEYMLGAAFANFPQIGQYARDNFGPSATPEDAFFDFINRINDYVKEKHGKQLRIWNDGLNQRNNLVTLDHDIIIEHWYGLESLESVADILGNGYEMMNSSVQLYLTRGGIQMDTNRLYNERWNVRNFDWYQQQNDSNGIRGAKVSLWQDNAPANTENEVEEQVFMPLRFVAQMTWADTYVQQSYGAFEAFAREIGRPLGWENIERLPLEDGNYQLSTNTRILQADEDGVLVADESAAQSWRFEATTDNYYKIQESGSNLCLDIVDGQKELNAPLESGVPVVLRQCANSNIQKWQVIDVEGGFYIVNAITGMRLSTNSEGRIVQLEPLKSTDLWQLSSAAGVSVEFATDHVLPNGELQVSAHIENTGTSRISGATIDLALPDGWRIAGEEGSLVEIGDVGSGESRSVDFVVTPGCANLGKYTIDYQVSWVEDDKVTRTNSSINITVGQQMIPVDYTTSSENAGPGTSNDGWGYYAWDGDESTIWHSKWEGGTDYGPHWLSMDLGESQMVFGFNHFPRQGNLRGQIKDYQIHLSMDGEDWGEPVAAGAFPADKVWTSVEWTPQEAKFIRITALNAYEATESANIAELSIETGPIDPGCEPVDPPVPPVYSPQITVDVAEVKPGDPIVVTGTGFAPGIDVVVSLGDTVLGTFHTSDAPVTRALAAGGEFSGRVTVPASTVSGQHTLKVAAKDGSHSAQLPITVKGGDPGETPDPKPGEKPEEKPGAKKPGTLPNVGATVAMLGFAGLALAGSGYVIRRQSRREKA